MLEFVEIKNLPEGLKGNVYVLFSKTQPDTIFNVKRKLSIHSESGEKQVALFNCQPTGHLLFEVFAHSTSNLPISKLKALGSTTISLEDFLVPVTSLSMEKWLELVPSSGIVTSKPIRIRAAISFTIPNPAPQVLHMVRSRPFSKGSCFFPLPQKVQFAKSWARITDEAGNELISLQMRYLYLHFRVVNNFFLKILILFHFCWYIYNYFCPNMDKSCAKNLKLHYSQLKKPSISCNCKICSTGVL